MAPPPSSSAALAQLWLFALCAALCATVDGLSGGAVGPGDVLGMAWCWAAVLSGGSPAVVGVAAGMRCAIVAARLPRCLAFEWMCLQSDAVVAFACLRHCRDAGRAAAAARSLVRRQWAVFFGAAAFWKLNSAYFDARTSCGSLLGLEVLALASRATRFYCTEPVVAAVARFAPHCVAGLEATVAGLLGATAFGAADDGCGRAGARVALGLFVVSTPRDAAPTALSAAARLVFFAGPDAVEAVFSAVDAVGALTGLGLLCACCFEPNGFFDWRDWSGDDWCLVVGAPLLGLSELAAPTKSTNLRVHGGSNHWLAPTGLLLSTRTGLARLDDAYYDAGAVVRVEATTSPTLRAAFPGEVRLDPPGVEKVVRVGKQAGRTFDSGRALAGRALDAPTSKRHPLPPAYTVPLAALLDVLAAAARDAETFDVTFAVLPGRAGDEAWRATATAATVAARYEAGALAACEGDEAACDRLRSERGPPRATFLAYPILDGFREELVCVG
ncbi:hypothetical protein SO694_00172039 [Aureococcus anophagefferens]|uniref:Uncharacterized protein n=1 Tax=Aureococcus anophagefferens TaxID=44056 RepID=A0ABR1FH94_AURAN